MAVVCLHGLISLHPHSSLRLAEYPTYMQSSLQFPITPQLHKHDLVQRQAHKV